jgi:acyl-coenzyme A thioesterase PaaI-like protein
MAVHVAEGRADHEHVTADFQLSDRRPVPTGQRLRVRGRCLRTQGRDVFSEGEIVSPDGEVLTHAQARWRRIPRRG